MTFSSHMDMIFKNSALQDIFVKLLFIEYRLLRRYPLYEKVMSGYVSTMEFISDLLQRGQSLNIISLYLYCNPVCAVKLQSSRRLRILRK